jgi:hypothetical protein
MQKKLSGQRVSLPATVIFCATFQVSLTASMQTNAFFRIRTEAGLPEIE